MKVVRPKQPTLGEAMVLRGQPPLPTRPMMHKSGPPTIESRKGHPTLTAPAVPAPLPARATQGVNSNQLNAYVKALQNGPK